MLRVYLDGAVVPGTGSASRNLEKQIPLIAKEFPEVANCHRGSINFSLECALRIDHPDHTTEIIAWQEHEEEVFGFLRIHLAYPVDAAPKRAWIYIPHNSPHFRNCFQVEVIAEKIEGLALHSRCRIYIPRGRFDPGGLVV